MLHAHTRIALTWPRDRRAGGPLVGERHLQLRVFMTKRLVQENACAPAIRHKLLSKWGQVCPLCQRSRVPNFCHSTSSTVDGVLWS